MILLRVLHPFRKDEIAETIRQWRRRFERGVQWEWLSERAAQSALKQKNLPSKPRRWTQLLSPQASSYRLPEVP
jgi:hypothetical protein